MKILFGTDLLLCYLLRADYIDGIQLLLDWMNKIGDKKIVDPSSIAILTNFAPISKFKQLNDFTLLTKIYRPTERIKQLLTNPKYKLIKGQTGIKTLLPHLTLLDSNLIDFLITENPLMFQLARELNLDDRVYGIENYIEKCSYEHRDLDTTKGVVVKTIQFGNLSLNDVFFETFIRDYSPHYVEWFYSKSKDLVYISEDENKSLKALLKLKIEGPEEDYSDITPMLPKARRLKICSFKVDYTGEKLGERFMRIIFDQALEKKVDEIYVTIYNNSKIRKRLLDLLERWGFYEWGKKKGELVYLRKLNGPITGDLRKDFPFHSFKEEAYIIPLHKIYFSQLLPSKDVRNSFFDYEPSKYGVRKVLILHESLNPLKTGAILLFYQKTSILKDRGIMAIGVVENSYSGFNSHDAFLNRCRKRSILQNVQLLDCWKKANGNPMVVNFLFVKTLAPNEIRNVDLEAVDIDTNKLINQVPLRISKEQFNKLIKGTTYESYLTIN